MGSFFIKLISKHIKFQHLILSALKTEKNNSIKFNHLFNKLSLKSSDRGNLRNALSLLTNEGKIFKKGKYYILKEFAYRDMDKSSGEITGGENYSKKGMGFERKSKKTRGERDTKYHKRESSFSSRTRNKNQDEKYKSNNKIKSPTSEPEYLIEKEIKITGKFLRSKFFGLVVPDSKIVTKEIFISAKNYNNAKDGDKVVCILIKKIDGVQDDYEFEGKIVMSLGVAGDIATELESIYYKFDLNKNCPKNIESSANSINTKFEVKDRIDLRSVITVTIDPEDAKDFDDAISIQKSGKDEYILGIHIADVSYFVKEDSDIDVEAMSRGTSVYLVNKVVPMLPEKLSNDICSLKENQDRLTFSVLVTLNKAFKLKSYEIKESVIRSNKRFSYEKVQDILDSKKGIYSEDLLLLHRISQSFYKERMKKGSLDFESTEVKILIDDKFNITSIKLKPRLNSMRMIEEFMLLANKCVTEFVHKTAKDVGSNLPFIYRIHDKPDNEKLSNLTQFIKQFGYFIDLEDKSSLKNLLDTIKGKQESFIINDLLIRSMAKAKYADKNIGHYGLGFIDYTHFTSPIRRYPDLVVHRLIKRYLNQHIKAKSIKQDAKKVEEICKISTLKEQNAVYAEREYTKVLQINYLSKFIGDEFDGIISGIVSYGMFVELSDIMVEGLVRFRDMEDDYYNYDENKLLVTGCRRHKTFRAGQKVNVKIINVNIEARKIDLSII